jgi:hypothetical protein
MWEIEQKAKAAIAAKHVTEWKAGQDFEDLLH